MVSEAVSVNCSSVTFSCDLSADQGLPNSSSQSCDQASFFVLEHLLTRAEGY